MNRATSLYLDALRLIAALGVFIGHANFSWFYSGAAFIPDVGHQLVVLFFFLSGYVVADATLGKPRGVRHYITARLSRLYSVVLPAVLLTAAAYIVGAFIHPEFYAALNRGHEVLRWLFSALFLQELWFLNASPPSNGPLWSLGYEFWFYVLFGCAVFVRGCWTRIASLMIVSLITGPKILLLLPVWLLGVAAWRVREWGRLSPWLARAGCLGSGLAAWWIATYARGIPGGESAVAPLYYAGQFVSDWALGLAIALHVFFFNRAFNVERVPGWMDRSIRLSAGMTFSLYAYHFPLLMFCAAVVPYGHDDPVGVGAVMGAVSICIVGLHQITETRRAWWQALFTRLVPAAKEPQLAQSRLQE